MISLSRLSASHRASSKNTELEKAAPARARSDCSMFDDAQEHVVHKPMPPLERACVKRLETPEEIALALRLAPSRKNSDFQSMVVGLEVLVIVCIVLAAIVWWRLLI